MASEQLKYVSIAIRSEDGLKKHMKYLNERKNMRKIIQKAKQF